MRVAFFGGTFDPIHRGHLRLASATADAFALDRVLFVPVGNQPLKPGPTVASYADRLQMARLACNPALLQPTTSNQQPATDPRFAVSTLDAPRPDGSPNYTVDSLAALARELPGASLYVLTGADSFLDLGRWRSPDRLLELAEWIVVSRPELPLSEFAARAARPYTRPARPRPSARHSPRGGLRHRPPPPPASRRPLPRPAPARRRRLHPEPRPLPLNPSML